MEKESYGLTKNTKNSPVNKNKKVEKDIQKAVKPPPVIVSNVENYREINQSLKARNLNFSTSMMNNNQLKINVDSERDYRELTKLLTESKL